MKNSVVIALLAFSAALSGCGQDLPASNPGPSAPLPPVGVPGEDNAVVHGRAVYTVTSTQQTATMKIFNQIFPTAYAAIGSTTVIYTNVNSTNFTINVASFAAGSFTGNTLSLGNVALASLSDNNLKVCGVGGTTKCTQAVIRVYTTGSIAGFVNTADAYGAPLYTGTLNPSSAVGLLSAGSVQVQTLTIPISKHTVSLSDFPSPTYNVTSDFSNAGAGSYSMTYVVEYALLP